jgi:hypothetical protein
MIHQGESRMPKVKLNPLFAEISGTIGNVVFKKSKNGQTYIASRPKKSKAKPSEAQLTQRKSFGKASVYANSALADEAMGTFYEARAEESNTTARALCMGDYLNAPTMDDLDFSRYHGQVGDRIQITTYDDVGVVEVIVKLAKADGTLIEYGKAVEKYPDSGFWEYVASMPVPLGTHIFISAEAFDRPGNRAAASANPIVGESD